MLLENVMNIAVEAGSLQASIDRLSAMSEAGELADRVRIKQRLLELDNLVDMGYATLFAWENHDPPSGPWPPLPENA